MKLWISSAMSPYGNPFGLVAVVAETKEEAVSKATAALDSPQSYVPAEQYRQNLLEHLDTMAVVDAGVVIDWSPTEKKR